MFLLIFVEKIVLQIVYVVVSCDIGYICKTKCCWLLDYFQMFFVFVFLNNNNLVINKGIYVCKIIPAVRSSITEAEPNTVKMMAQLFDFL